MDYFARFNLFGYCVIAGEIWIYRIAGHHSDVTINKKNELGRLKLLAAWRRLVI